MPKKESPEKLLKRLQKIQSAQTRLGDITGRIRAQADALAQLLTTAQDFAGEAPAAKPASRPRTAKSPAPKRTSSRATTAPATAAKRRSRPAAPAPARPASRRPPRSR